LDNYVLCCHLRNIDEVRGGALEMYRVVATVFIAFVLLHP